MAAWQHLSPPPWPAKSHGVEGPMHTDAEPRWASRQHKPNSGTEKPRPSLLRSAPLNGQRHTCEASKCQGSDGNWAWRTWRHLQMREGLTNIMHICTTTSCVVSRPRALSVALWPAQAKAPWQLGRLWQSQRQAAPHKCNHGA